MQHALDPLPLIEALQAAGIAYVAIGGLAVTAHGVIRPSKDLDIVPDPEPGNLRRLAELLRDLDAVHVGVGDFATNEFPYDPTDPEQLASGANFRLQTRLGDLDIMQWVAGIDADHAYVTLARNALEISLDTAVVRVCSLNDLRAMKRAAGRPRDVDDLERLEAIDG